MKLTKRKGFNFFRSYYDVYNELQSPEDKIAFIEALLDRQFLGIKPEGLKGMAKFAYISQTNSIDSQVKGYNDKQKALNNPLLGEVYPPTQGGKNTPTEQVEEKEKEKFIYTEKEFLEDWTQCRKTFLNVPTNFKSIKTYDLPKFNKAVKDYSKDQIREAMRGLFMQEVISFSSMTLQPSHFLENVDKYYNAFISKDKKLYGSKPVQQ